MKIILYLAILCFPFACIEAQSEISCETEHLAYVEAQEAEFANPEESPLTDEARASFTSINYFPFDGDYCVTANWKRTPDEKAFEMPTSTDRSPVYVKYGELQFEIKGEPVTLSVYQSERLMTVEGYEDYLFIPFNDLSNGVTSYGGGRYMDIRIPKGYEVQINLNNTYHPYCAYDHRYSCPIPPEENMLNIAIEAGVMSGLNGKKDLIIRK